MAGHIHWNRNTQYGRLHGNMVTANQDADADLVNQRNMLTGMLSGDGSDPAHFAEITRRMEVGDYNPTMGDPTDKQNQLTQELYNDLVTLHTELEKALALRAAFYTKYRG